MTIYLTPLLSTLIYYGVTFHDGFTIDAYIDFIKRFAVKKTDQNTVVYLYNEFQVLSELNKQTDLFISKDEYWVINKKNPKVKSYLDHSSSISKDLSSAIQEQIDILSKSA